MPSGLLKGEHQGHPYVVGMRMQMRIRMRNAWEIFQMLCECGQVRQGKVCPNCSQML